MQRIPMLPPGSGRDRLLMNPFEVQAAISGILTGLFALADLILNRPLIALRPWMGHVSVIILATGILLGGILILRGMFDGSDNLLRSWQIERSGLILSGAAWFASAAWSLWSEPGAILGWLTPFTLAGVMALQYWATVVNERKVRHSIGGDR